MIGALDETAAAKLIAGAIDADLERQVKVQSGCEYQPARDSEVGVASANMYIRPSEVARAVVAALQPSTRAVVEILAFDCTGFPMMEAKAVEWANRIAGKMGQPPSHPDPVGILEMCAEVAAAGLADIRRRTPDYPDEITDNHVAAIKGALAKDGRRER